MKKLIPYKIRLKIARWLLDAKYGIEVHDYPGEDIEVNFEPVVIDVIDRGAKRTFCMSRGEYIRRVLFEQFGEDMSNPLNKDNEHNTAQESPKESQPV